MTNAQNSTAFTLTLNVQWSAALDALIVATTCDPTRYYCVSRDWRLGDPAQYTVWAIGDERIGALTEPEQIPLAAFKAMQEHFGQDDSNHAQARRYLRDMVYAFSHVGYKDDASEAWWEGQYEPGISSDDVRRQVWNESKAFVEDGK